MGMLIDGCWSDQDQRKASASGAFVRPESSFRSTIGAPDSDYVAEPGRYHLFANAGCPWAYRALLYRNLKQLQPLLSLSLTQPAAGAEGWTFGQPEPLLGAVHMHHVYSAGQADFTGRATVPVLWCKHTQTIVNNESADIVRMLNSAFDHCDGVASDDFYPADLADQIDAWNAKIYPAVNNGVYRCGFAQSQQAYDEAFDLLFATLDELDEHLVENRYLCGDRVTEADWRLFSTLIRFDLAYHGQFRCNRNLLKDFPNLWPYTRDLYQHPRVAQTVDIEAIKGIYYGSREPRILPKGPVLDFAEPSGRT